MRALRSRPVSDTDNEDGNDIQQKKPKKRISDINEENTDKLEDHVVKKKLKKSKKKKSIESKNSSSGEIETQEVLEISEKDELSVKPLKKKKNKKVKKSQEENNSSTTTCEGETEVSDNQKPDNSLSNDEGKKKKSKRKKKLQNENQAPGNINGDDEESIKIKKKSKKMKLQDVENQLPATTQSNENDNFLSPSAEIKIPTESVKKSKSRKLRSTIVSSPNFDYAVTSTLMKPKRNQIFNDDNEELNSSNKKTKQKRLSEINDSAPKNNSPRKSNRRSSFGQPSKIIEENEILSPKRRSTLGISSEVDVFVKTRRSKSFKNSITAEDSINKVPQIKINNATASIIAISDSPDLSKVKQNTFNKTDTSEEDTLKENIKIERRSSLNRRETFNKLPRNKVLVEESVITITDTPDKTAKRNTFNKTEMDVDKTFDKSSRKSTNSNESTLTKDQSLKKNTSTNRKTRSSGKSRISGLSEVGESILDASIIDITESPEKIAEVIEPKETHKANNTYELEMETNKSNNTYDMEANTSGDWKVEKKGKLNETILNKTENKENHVNKTPPKVLSMSPKDQSIRKKWLKFPRHSTDAKSVLEQISSPRLQKKMNAIMNTPKDLYNLKKPSVASMNLSLNKSVKKSPIIKKSPLKSIKKSTVGSTKKSATKRTVMPNFALIHQKAFEKMENLKEYSDRKQQRAQALLSSKKPESARKTTEPKPVETKKSSRQLFTNDNKEGKFNRFGFKITENKPIFSAKPVTNIPVIKPSVFSKPEVAAVANKKAPTSKNRENRRDMLKGVRTNRRFELLMQMRNK